MSYSAGVIGVPALGKHELEYLAEEHTKSFSAFDGKNDPSFSVWKFAAYYLGKKVGFEWLSNDGCILGLSSFVGGTSVPVFDPGASMVRWRNLEANTILLSKTLENMPYAPGKPRFTLMHECAHHLLHKGYFQARAAKGSGKAVAYSLQRDEERLHPQEKKEWSDEERIEWQANYLASALLMPESRVERVLEEKGYKEDYFQHVLARSPESAAYRQLLSGLAFEFRVSMTVAQIRIETLGFERFPDLSIRKPDPWFQYGPEPKKKRMTKEERRQERIEIAWEEKRIKERGR